MDPIFGNLSPLRGPSTLGPSPQALRYWVHFFSNQSSSPKPILIPDMWMNFFTFLLLQSPSFDWAKTFLESKAWDFFNAETNGNATLFSLPSVCPDVTIPVCANFESSSSVILELMDDESEDQGITVPTSTPKKRKARGKDKAPISEDEVRRSERLRKIHKRFKSTVCKDGNCLGCSVDPPSISPKVIRSLGAAFYGLDPQDLTENKLNAPVTKKKKAVGKGSSQESSTSSSTAIAPTPGKNKNKKVVTKKPNKPGSDGSGHGGKDPQ